jgi:hypothetical protein
MGALSRSGGNSGNRLHWHRTFLVEVNENRRNILANKALHLRLFRYAPQRHVSLSLGRSRMVTQIDG